MTKRAFGTILLVWRIKRKEKGCSCQSMQAKGFPLTINEVGQIAYDFAERLYLKHRINKNIHKIEKPIRFAADFFKHKQILH